MAGLFAKVASKKVADAPKREKGTPWLVGDSAGDKIADAVRKLVDLSRQAKNIETQMAPQKAVVKKFAEQQYVSQYAAAGVSPDSPMTIQTADGEKVTYVVQDRSTQYAVKEEQVDALKCLLGEDAAADLLFEETRFGFNRLIMMIPGVQEAVESALESALERLTSGEMPVLNQEQAEELLEVDQKLAFKPGTLDRLSVIAGRDTGRIKAFLDIMGSSATRYVKV